MRTLMAVVLAMLGVVGCVVASAPAQSTPAYSAPLGSAADIQALRERAAAYWAARLAGDLRTQWELLEPRGSGRITAEEYGARGSARYLGYQVEDATVSGFFATVKVRVLFQPTLPLSAASRVMPAMAGVLADGWVRIGGLWYHRVEEGESGLSQARQP